MIQSATTTPTAASAPRAPSMVLGLAVFALPGEAENIGDGSLVADDRQEDGKDGKLLPAALPEVMPFDPWAALAAFMPMPVAAPVAPADAAPVVSIGSKVSVTTALPSVAMPTTLPDSTIPAASPLPAVTPLAVAPADLVQFVHPDPDLPNFIMPMPSVDPVDGLPAKSVPVVDAPTVAAPHLPAKMDSPVTTIVLPSVDKASSGVTTPAADLMTAAATAKTLMPAPGEPTSAYRRPDVSLAAPVSNQTLAAATPRPMVTITRYQRLDMPPVVDGPIERPAAATLSIPLPATWQMSPAVVAAQPLPVATPSVPAVPEVTPLPSFDAAMPAPVPTPEIRSIEVPNRDNTPPPPFLPAAPAPAGVVFSAARMAAGLTDQAIDTPKPIAIDASAPPVAGIDHTLVSVVPVAMAAEGPPLDLADHRWPQAMLDRIEMLRDAADAVDTRIRVVPDALGAIEVGVRQEGDTLHVRFTADQAQTRTLLQEAQPRLAEAAEQRGLRLGQTSVGAGVDTGTTGQGQHRPPPTPPSADPRRTTANTTIATTADTAADDDTRIA
ncbi:flagellar hook-length control protein FliK [Sphingomonas mollis]|uniref:Flagellar hook-length control protein FliK n=1 Tax=Sphingomonas mollis TaxID=2795726 RepID=A0ABS0XU57_9SPHN|nr:flagellar hook-length control protein FliK [Sphingomonas sp. BT553]MBJ6123582.1 flagellar hook-length control protein FliK [Sphingomonas sp. BT553]